MTTLRIGRPPRLPRRQRIARVLNQSARYVAAYTLVGWACYWLGDIHLFVPGMLIAAMVANPWRPKRPARPAWAGSGMRVYHSLLLRTRAVARGGLPSGLSPPIYLTARVEAGPLSPRATTRPDPPKDPGRGALRSPRPD